MLPLVVLAIYATVLNIIFLYLQLMWHYKQPSILYIWCVNCYSRITKVFKLRYLLLMLLQKITKTTSGTYLFYSCFCTLVSILLFYFFKTRLYIAFNLSCTLLIPPFLFLYFTGTIINGFFIYYFYLQFYCLSNFFLFSLLNCYKAL